MTSLANRRILLAVSGGIAAYKTPELVRRMKDAGADVRVMLTAAGAKFVSKLTLEVVSGHPVGEALWATDGESRIVHTDAGQGADLIVLAPATANLIGRIRHGLADDLVSTTVMASQTPVLICPSMNTDMLDNPLVQDNLNALTAMPRYSAVEPDEGLLACGVTGRGRLPDPPALIDAMARLLGPRDMDGVRVTVTAGPTREAIDPVRFLTNRSTGTMGFALAGEFAHRGAAVTLIAGPITLDTPRGVIRRVDVSTAADVAAAVDAAWEQTDVLIMAAAVADYRPAAPARHKLKKGPGDLSLNLVRTTDILAATADLPERDTKFVVGFAAETEDVQTNARHKLEAKGLDAIVANDVSEPGVGFGAGDNAGYLVTPTTVRALARTSKARFAREVADLLTPLIAERHRDR